MDDIRRLLDDVVRVRSESLASDATQSSGSRACLRQRLHQLMTCVEDLDPANELHEKVANALDKAFVLCGQRAHGPRIDRLRW